MRKQHVVMTLVALPFPPQWLPAIAFGVAGGVAAYLVYLPAVRGL